MPKNLDGKKTYWAAIIAGAVAITSQTSTTVAEYAPLTKAEAIQLAFTGALAAALRHGMPKKS